MAIETVIFRTWKGKEGGVIALFPETPADAAGYLCLSFERIGGHGAADPMVVQRTRPARPEEYRELLAYLVRLYGYPLRPMRRMSPRMTEERRALARAMR